MTRAHPTKRSKAAQAIAASSAALVAALSAGGAGAGARSAAPEPPDAVRIPQGLDLGQTSYYDALVATNPGLTVNLYASRQVLDQIAGPDGRPSPAFNHPKIDVEVLVVQLIYVAHEFDSGCIGLNLLQPFVDFDAQFRTPGAVLRDNGFGPGDTTVGAFFQSKPVKSGGQALFYWRAEMDAIAPFGSFDSSKDLDQGAGYASLNPYVAFTYLPAPRLEISGRANYLYNFSTNRAPNLAPASALSFRNGQAGQAAWLNFDASYEVTPRFSIGANGYYLTQLTEDRFDGLVVPGSKAEELYVGPGFHWVASQQNILNANYYVPVSGRNLPLGPKINFQYIHPF